MLIHNFNLRNEGADTHAIILPVLIHNSIMECGDAHNMRCADTHFFTFWVLIPIYGVYCYTFIMLFKGDKCSLKE